MSAADSRWYVVHTYSGYENLVAQTIVKAAENRGMMRTELNPNPTRELIYATSIPVEMVKETVDDKEREVERKVFPGYVLVKMELTDDSWHLVRNVRGVTGFVGSANKPLPLSDDEAAKWGVVTAAAVSVEYKAGSSVKIISGPFESFLGTVESVDANKELARVIVSMFGRETPVDINFSEIKLEN